MKNTLESLLYGVGLVVLCAGMGAIIVVLTGGCS